MEQANRIDRIVTKVYFVLAIIVGIGLCAMPIVLDFINFWFYDIEPAAEMPFKTFFIFDTKTSPAYELTYLTLIYATNVNIFIAVRSGSSIISRNFNFFK